MLGNEPEDETTPEPVAKVSPLWGAIVKAQADLHAVGKRGHARDYDYASAESVISAVTTVIQRHGLAVIRYRTALTSWTGPETVKVKPGKYDKNLDGKPNLSPTLDGETRIIGVLRGYYLIAHESGEQVGRDEDWRFDQVMIKGAGRTADQDLNTATTYLHSYALLGIFNIPRVDVDPEQTRGGQR